MTLKYYSAEICKKDNPSMRSGVICQLSVPFLPLICPLLMITTL